MVVVHGFGVSIVYYLDGGVVGLVRLDLSIGVLFWMRYFKSMIYTNGDYHT